MYAKAFEQADMAPASPNSTGTDSDLVILLALREIEASGPLTGLEAINRVASTTRLLGVTPPGYALLHGLTEKGLLESPAGRPRLYRITDAGSSEAERLAERCWPRLHGEVVRLSRRVAAASPRVPSKVSYLSEWADESIDRGH